MIKHSPFHCKSFAERLLTILFNYSSVVDKYSQTAVCTDCGGLLLAPSLEVYNKIAPILCGLFCGCTFIVYRLIAGKAVIHESIPLLIYLLFFRYLIPAFILSVGEWKAAPVGSMSNQEYMLFRAKELSDSRKSASSIIAVTISVIFGLLLCFGGSILASNWNSI